MKDKYTYASRLNHYPIRDVTKVKRLEIVTQHMTSNFLHMNRDILVILCKSVSKYNCEYTWKFIADSTKELDEDG